MGLAIIEHASRSFYFGVRGNFRTVAIKSVTALQKIVGLWRIDRLNSARPAARPLFVRCEPPKQSQIAMGELTYCVLGKLTELCAPSEPGRFWNNWLAQVGTMTSSMTSSIPQRCTWLDLSFVLRSFYCCFLPVYSYVVLPSDTSSKCTERSQGVSCPTLRSLIDFWIIAISLSRSLFSE